MQCQIRGMGEAAESTRPPDTLPRSGRVNEVCREWLVHEDGALAYRLQKEEVDQHLSGNKTRNAVVRRDTPLAKCEQKREEEEALARLAEERLMQEALDSNVALKLAERLDREEQRQRQARLQRDADIARRLHEREFSSVNVVGLPQPQPQPQPQPLPLPLPPPPEELMRQLEVSRAPSVVAADWMEDEARRIQEQKDAELARQLQEEEQGVPDRLLAIEAQDEELARMLQEKEKAKLRRAKERAKQKALLRRQQQGDDAEENCYSLPHSANDPQEAAMARSHAPRINKSRFPDPEAIEVILPSGDTVAVTPGPGLGPGLGPGPASAVDSARNIAAVIDPTYPRHHSESLTMPPVAATPAMTPCLTETDASAPTPPYMPVQGQRRISSLEKKNKKTKSKDGCRQQ